MEAIELLKTRRSCRFYQETQINDDELNTVLECAINAPSGMNKQDTKIVVIQDKEVIAHLSKLNASVMNATHDPFYGAPTLCLILAPKESSNNLKDGACVITQMQNAAYALGLGSCWINRCEQMLQLEEGKEYLKKWNLEDYMGVGCCILGYPAKEYPEKILKQDRIIRI